MRLRFLSALLLLFSAVPASAQWTWLYPKPQGHTLNDVQFLDDATAIAVGEVGTVMVTHDAGLTWSASTKINGITAELRKVARLDASTAVVVGEGGLMLKTSNSGISWDLLSSGAAVTLEDVDFVGQLGLAAGTGTMIRSVNGGESWVPVLSGFQFHGVDVVTSSIAVAIANNAFLRSENGGQTWTSSVLFFSPAAVAFLDELNGVTSFSNSYYFTNDGGQTWDERPGPLLDSHTSASASEIEYIDSETFYVSATAGGCDGMMNCFSAGFFFRSTLGDGDWNYEASGSARPLNGLARNSAGVVLAVGVGGAQYRWTEPETWQHQGGSQYNELDDDGAAAFLSPSVGIVVGTQPPISIANVQTTFLRTSNGGADWTAKSLFGTHVTDIAYAPSPAPAVYAVGRRVLNGITNAVIFKSTDGGASWPTLWSSTSAIALNALDFASGSHAVAVGGSGAFAVIDNDVVTPGTIVDAGALQDVAFADADYVVAVGAYGGVGPPTGARIARSSNGGSSWTLIPNTLNRALYGVNFASASTGVAVGAGGTILRTEDSGATWTVVSSPTSKILIAVAFSSALHGFAVGDFGIVLETGDGGTTWVPIETPTTLPFTDVESFGPAHALMTSRDLVTLEYRVTPVPTLISSFDAIAEPFAAALTWSVRDEANLARFTIRRRDGAVEKTIAESLSGTARSFRDSGLTPGRIYEYQLLAIDHDGSTIPSAPVTVTIPGASLQLLPNQPNPFNPSTTIRFVLPERAPVRLSVYDIAGRRVITLLDETRDAGTHSVEWNGLDAKGVRVASGVYVSRLDAGKQSATRKMVLLK